MMAYRLMSQQRIWCKSAANASIFTRMARRLLSFDVTSPKEFEEKVLQSKLPVVVDFHASWCGPCKVLGPNLTAVVEEYEGKVDLAKVDVDELQDLALEYGVMSIPTVLAIRGGEITDQFVGAKEVPELIEFVDKLVKE